jgi:hypothetical protein
MWDLSLPSTPTAFTVPREKDTRFNKGFSDYEENKHYQHSPLYRLISGF